MPDAIITSTASTFGTITGTFAADQSTITGTVTGIITGTLDGSVGVPGVGVPDGGTTGQVLQKATNTSYDTIWATPSGGAWGTITGTLSNQTDLQTALNLKAPLASPSLTGVPTAPTAATLTSTTQLATTAFVQQELLSGTANAKNLEVYVRNQTGATLTAGTIVYINGATGNRPTITKAQANNDANSAQTFGFTKASIANNGFGFVIVRGELENVDTSALTEGVQLYLSPTTAGAYTTTKPSAPQHLVYVGICVRAHPTQGVILVAVQNGYELNELHDVQIVSPTNGQVLKYNSTTSLWYNGLDVGIPVGGTAGQFLTKIDGTDYNTDWTTVNLSAYAVKSNNLSDLTSASTARTNLGLGTMATATASDYSTTTVANGLYYPLSTNPAGYLTSASLTGYATESWVTAGFYPLTGNPSGYITSSALTPYLTSATAASTYQTLSGMSSYLTTSAAASTYLTQSNAASTYQTLSGMSSYLTTSTAASTYATILEPSVDGILTVEPSGSNTATVQVNQDANNYIHLRAGVGQIAMVYGGSLKWLFTDSYLQFPGGTQQTVAYPGPSGFLLKADNLSGLANTGTARTNLGLGTMAVETASNYLTTATAASTYQTLSGMSSYLTTSTAASTYQTISGMSSYLTTASAASTYFTIASAANKADLASPALTGTPTAPTASPGTNTTQLATTAFVTTADNLKANLASPTFTGVPAAPTATAGTNTTQLATTAFVTAAVPAFATLAESIGGAVTNKIIAPDDAEFLVTNSDLLAVNRPYLSGVTSGTGASAFTTGFTSYVNAPNGGAGHAVLKTFGLSQLDQLAAFWNSTGYNGINYSKRIHISGRCGIDPLTDTNITAFVTFGKLSADAPGDMVRKGIGWKYQLGGGANFLNLIVHNGTSQTAIATTFQQSSAVPFSWDIVSDGSGGVKLYINGVERATTSSGPTGTMTSNTPCYTEEIVASAAAAVSYQRLTATRGCIYVQTK